MPRYVSNHSLQVGPISDLMGSRVTCVGLGNAYTRLLGYMVIWVQVDGVWGYNEDQIALVILDFSNFAARVPVILGMPTIGQVVNVMREAEMDDLVMPWANARAAHLLVVHRMMPMESGWWPGGKIWYEWWWPVDVYSERGNHRALLFPYSTSEERESLCGRMH